MIDSQAAVATIVGAPRSPARQHREGLVPAPRARRFTGTAPAGADVSSSHQAGGTAAGTGLGGGGAGTGGVGTGGGTGTGGAGTGGGTTQTRRGSGW